MRLTELNPNWVVGDPNERCFSNRHGMGIRFDCPIHRSHRIVAFFTNPIDGLPPRKDGNKWDRAGDTFETITLSPSIDASGQMFGTPESPCWHGYIRNGEVI